MRISDWSSDVCSSDLPGVVIPDILELREVRLREHLWLGMLRLEATLLRGCELRLCIGILAACALIEPLRLALGALLRGCPDPSGKQIGRASCRERVCQYV